MTSISSASTQYIVVPVRAWLQGLPYNPTLDQVEMAFVTGSAPPASWNAAAWAWTTTVQGYYGAQCLVGPDNGGVDLSIGTYTVWVRIVDNPEIPVISCGSLTITP